MMLRSSSSVLCIAFAALAAGCDDGTQGRAAGAGGSASSGEGSSGSESTGSKSSSGAGPTSGSGSTSTGSTSSSGGPAAYHVDISQTSVSGLSAGGFMAVQFHVAFSSIMKGAAIFAGGPYDCAQGSLSTAEIQCQYPFMAPAVAPFIAATNQNAAAGTIDDPKALGGQRVFLFGGANDQTVAPVTMDALEAYYTSFMSPASVVYENRHLGTGHTMPTVAYGGACAATASPWIGACNYDGAGKALEQIYGALNPPAASLGGSFVTIDQKSLLDNAASHSVADTGYAYVPAACAGGEQCRFHVSFHGCKQYASGPVGDAYYKHAGYNEWADTNHIIVVYPQTIPSAGLVNPNGCFDWWGYDSPDYAKKTGPQMAMVREILRSLSGQ